MFEISTNDGAKFNESGIALPSNSAGPKHFDHPVYVHSNRFVAHVSDVSKKTTGGCFERQFPFL